MEEGTEKAAVVAALLEKAVDSTAREVDRRLLKAIKSTVRYDDSELRCAAQTLFSLMKRQHSQVRYLALLIIDELFMRSKLFRSLLVENLDQLLSLSIGFRRSHSLPPPVHVATTLRSKAIEFLEKWNESFGIHYRQLRLGYDYLKNTLNFQFPNLRANAARRERERREREMKTKEILLKKFESLRVNFSSVKEEIQTNIDEIDECLEILRPEDGDMPFDPMDDEEVAEFRNSELWQIRLAALREQEKVHENSDNQVVADALRESYKVLVTKHLAAVQEWISLLIRVEAPDNRFRDYALKNLIDIRNLIQSTKRKCEESGCELSKTANAEEEEDVWEDGIVETLDKGKSDPSCSKTTDAPSSSTAKRTTNEKPTNISSNGIEKKNITSSGSESDPLRSKLLGEAPVLNWGSFLDSWGSNRDALANQRGLDLDGHWGRVDQDAVIPAEKIAELNFHSSVYKEEPGDTQPCRAPMRKGGLCQRRDSKVCVFHGPIIPRDDNGNPINENLSGEETAVKNETEESTLDCKNNIVDQLGKQAVKNVRGREIEEARNRALDEKALKKAKLANENPSGEETAVENETEEWSLDGENNIVDQLAKQAVRNVRGREREEVRKRVLDEKALKKAKLAKIREHNQACLKDSAIASTSRSYYVGEDMETGNGSGSSAKAKKKKQTLASMLKTKETAKRRLGQRLLNARAKEATIRQLTVAQEANYREAFPNQW